MAENEIEAILAAQLKERERKLQAENQELKYQINLCKEALWKYFIKLIK